MININNYISEKLHLSKDTGKIKSVQDIYKKLDSFLYDELKADYHYFQLNRISDNHRKIQFSGTKTKGQEYGNKIKEYIKNYKFKYEIEDHVNDYMYILNIIVTDESIDDTYYVSEKLHLSKDTKILNWDDLCEEIKEIIKKQDIVDADWWLSLHKADSELVVIFREPQASSLERYYNICHELYKLVKAKKDGFNYEVKDDKKHYIKITIIVSK